MIASFVLLWVWFFANRSGNVSPFIHALLAISMIALVAIFVRRLKRVRDAMNETQKPTGLPFMPPGFDAPPHSSNGTNGHYKKSDKRFNKNDYN